MNYQSKTHPVDSTLPLPKLLALGLQHLLIMYAGVVTIPLLVGETLFFSTADIAILVNSALFVCGIATLIQTIGVWWFGVRLPMVVGLTFAAIAPILAISTADNFDITYIYGATIAAGAIGIIVAPLISKMIRFFPPVVTGSIITIIGLSIIKVAIDWSAGGIKSTDYGSMMNIGIAFSVLVFILLFIRFTSGFIANISVLLGIVFGLAISLIFRNIPQETLSKLNDAQWFGITTPFKFGMPHFDPWVILPIALIMIVTFIESSGMLLAVGDVVDSPVNEKKLACGLRANALGTLIGGIFNSFPLSTFSQNVGLVVLTGVKSRWVCATSGVMLVALSMLPKVAVLIASIPKCVIGGAGIVMFGLVLSTGIRILSRADLRHSKSNLYIIAISIGIGMIPILSPNFFQNMPEYLSPFFKSGILLTAVTAVLLNIFLKNTSSD